MFHATMGRNKESILKNGLLVNQPCTYQDQIPTSAVYLATDEEVAKDFVEVFMDEMGLDDTVVVFEVDDDYVKGKIFLDPNVLDNDGSSFCFPGNIPPEKIRLLEEYSPW